MKGWRQGGLAERLNGEYAKQFGIEAPNWPPKAAQNS